MFSLARFIKRWLSKRKKQDTFSSSLTAQGEPLFVNPAESEGSRKVETKDWQRQVDERIASKHRSTRVVLPFFRGLHHKLSRKYQWYHQWHMQKYSSHIHATILIVAIISGTYLGLQLNTSVNPVQFARAANTCQSNGTSGGNWGTAASWQNCSGTTPQSADSVEILSGDTITLNISASVVSVTIDLGGILNGSSNTLTLTGTGTPFVKTGTFTASTSTVKYTGAGDTTIAAADYYNLETSPTTSAGVSAAGDSGYNGTYTSSGTFNGQPTYTNGTNWLCYSYVSIASLYFWVLDTTVADTAGDVWFHPYYASSSGVAALNGAWSAGTGAAPAPSVNLSAYTFASGTVNIAGSYTNGDGVNSVSTTANTNDPTINVSGSFTNSAGATFVASNSATLSVATNWTNSGTFTHSSGTVTLDGSAQIVTGDTTFNNLTATTAGDTISFASTSTQTVAGTWTVTGTSGSHIVLARSGGSGLNQWNVNPTNTNVSYVTVANSYNHGSTITPTGSTDGSNNTGWTFLSAPTAPSGVSIGSLGTTGFTVAWTDNSSDETGFKVYTAAGNADCSLATYSGTPDFTTAANATSQAITGKSINSQYCAKVVATNGAGDSSAAYASPKFTLANTPGAPTVNTPTTTSLKIIINQNSNPAGTEYAIYNDTTSTYVQADGTLGAVAWQNYAAWGGASGIVNTGLSSGVFYTYKVKARNGDLTATSLSSGTATSTTATSPPAAASGVSIGSLDSTFFTVSWTDNSSDETGFKVYTAAGTADCSLATYSGTPDFTTAVNATSQAITGKSINSQYCAKVIATNGAGDSSAAYASPKFTLANTPGAPTVNTPTTTSLKIIINQNSNPAGTEYAIYNDTTSTYVQADGTLGAVAWQNYAAWGGASGIVNTGLSSGVFYTYKVKARNGDLTATSLSSGTATSTTATSPPAAASGVSIGSLDSTFFTVSWTDNSSDETGFKVYTAAGTADCSLATYSGTPDFTTAVNATSQAITGKSINSQYCAKVIATNGAGDSSAAYAAPKYTLANTPSFTIVSGNYSDANSYYLDSTINANNNPAGTNYYIQYSTNDSTYSDPAGMAWQTDTAYQLISLSANQQYWLKVKAKNGDGVSTSYSSSSADITPPAAPTNLTTSNICSTTALASWTAATGANTYSFSYGTDTAAANLGETGSIAATEKTLSSLTDQTAYYWKVKSTSTANGTGPYSSPVSFVTSYCISIPIAPADFSGAAASVSQINWRWSDNTADETGWKIADSAGSNLSGNLAANSTSWDETSLSVNTAYTRHVNVFNGLGGNDSNQATIYTLANPPDAPTLTVLSSSSIGIKINKNGNPDANTRYSIAVSADNGTTWNFIEHHNHTIQTIPDWQLYADWGGNSGFTENNLTPSIPYIYKVQTENGNGIITVFSPASTQATPAAEITTPPVVTNPAPTSLIVVALPPMEQGFVAAIDRINTKIANFLHLPEKAVPAATSTATVAMAGVAAAAAPVVSAMTVLSLPEYLRAVLLLIFSVGPKKKRRQCGKVVEEGSLLPIPQVRINLMKLTKNISGIDESKIVQTVYSDAEGNYAFVAEPGRYLLDIHKDMYKVSAESNSYRPFSIITVSDASNSLIIPSITLNMDDKSAEKTIRSLKHSDLLERVLQYMSFGFLIFGTYVVVTGLISNPKSTSNIIIALIYPCLWWYNIRSIRKVSPFGNVLNRANSSGVPLALIRIMDQDGKKMVKTAITNKEGRYQALLAKGTYKMLVAKTGYQQPAPVMLDASGDLNTINKKIELDKIVPVANPSVVV